MSGGEPQDWYFSFGSGHRLFADLAGNDGDRGSAEGIPLSSRYVVIHDTYLDARARMVQVFGQRWCDQYGSPEAIGAERYGLTELVIAPAPALRDAQGGQS